MPKDAINDYSTLELTEDRARALQLVPVSRETLARLDRLVEVLLPVAAHTNLIARSTIPQLWTRHIADSLQLLSLAPDAKCWIDLGSGAGFPGLVIACAIADQPGASIDLVESIQKKAAFLREAAQQIQVPAKVHAVRIEDFGKNTDIRADVVTARALAPLDHLMRLAHPLLKSGALGLFPKGQDVEGELTEASKSWNIEASLVPSKTSPASRIVVVKALAPRQKNVKSHVKSRR
jgi:16S rRNA (guanine527-N7)-methyltransferase